MALDGSTGDKPMVTFGSGEPKSLTESAISAEIRAKYGTRSSGGSDPRDNFEKAISYKVVGRLSRWEGGNTSPYQDDVHSGTEGHFMMEEEPQKVSFIEFLRQFWKPFYDLTEVTIEDIERVKVMHDRFLNDSQFSFNYTTLLIIASVIAAMGLASNGGPSIIASMLVSPLMGPVTAMAYGQSIGDYKMVRMAFVTEITSLVICIIIGVVFAACMLPFPIAESWPTAEMLTRTTIQNLYVGIPIAFFSGLGVSVGLLDSQTNSLVGVAISASLLPPAVNAGMLWVGHYSDSTVIVFDGKTGKAGFISLALTAMNIVLIIIAAMFMFRLKETLPIEKSIFWTDLGIARKIYHNLAIIPKLQHAPDDKEIKKRVTMFFPRASAMVSHYASSGNRSLDMSSSNFSEKDMRSSSVSRPGLVSFMEPVTENETHA